MHNKQSSFHPTGVHRERFLLPPRHHDSNSFTGSVPARRYRRSYIIRKVSGRNREEKLSKLTAWPFVLDGDGPLQGAAHGPHLAGAAVTVAVGAAHRVGRLRTRLRALAHRLAVLHHAHGAVLAPLFQAGAGLAEV